MLEKTLIFETLVCFISGAIPFAIIALWGTGIDIRKVGSGNPGFNNVLRVSKPRAALTLLGDMAKGYIPVWFFYDPSVDPLFHGWLFAFAAVFGHCYSPFLNFNGGKGIATSSGVMLRLFPQWAALGLLFFIAIRVLASNRKWPEAGAIGSIATWVFFSLMMYLYEDGFATRNAALMTLYLTWRHKSNIQRFFASGHA